MSWTDRQWDDWVRGQPGTFWGEEKRRLSQPANIPPPAYHSPNVDHGSRPGQTHGRPSRPKREKSIEEHLHGFIMLIAGGGVGYLTYDLGAAAWIVLTAAVGAMVLGHLALASRPGQKFLHLLAVLLGLAMLALAVGGLVFLALAIIKGLRENG